MADLNDAEIVIVGGGTIGCAIAHSLAQQGKTDILLIEKEDALVSVTSSQAAGLVGQVRATVDRIKLAMWSVATFSKLQSEPEVNPNWRQVGSLSIAETDARINEFRRLKRLCDECGLQVELIDAAQAKRIWPGLRLDTAKAILWCPSDGYLQPYDLAMSYRHHARRMGVCFATGTAVEDIVVRNRRMAAVKTSKGTVRCETVINAAGAHAYHIAKLVGLELPIIPVRIINCITAPIDGVKPTLPVVRFPDSAVNMRPEVTGLLVGGSRQHTMSVDPRTYGLAKDAPAIQQDLDVLAELIEGITPFFPPIYKSGIRNQIMGWPTFTPDGKFVIGESSQVKGFIMAGGCNANGVAGSAGIGRYVVEAMLEKNPGHYVKSLSPDRFTETGWDWMTAQRMAEDIRRNYVALGR